MPLLFKVDRGMFMMTVLGVQKEKERFAAKLKDPGWIWSILGYLRLGFFFFIFIKCPKSSEYDITTNPGKGR
jgi:hypothetical protein